MTDVNDQSPLPDTSESPSRALRRRILHPATLLSFGVAVLLLVALAKGTDINVLAMADAIRESNPVLLALAFVIYYLNFPIRGLRWRILAQDAAALTALDRSTTWLSVVLLGAIMFAWREGVRRGQL